MNYSNETMTFLERTAQTVGVSLLRPRNLDEVIALKADEIRRSRPKLVILIGGSASVTGGVEASLPPGLILPGQENETGEGVARAALEIGIPVLHLLNVRALLQQVNFHGSGFGWHWSLLSIILFFLVLMTHRRWSWEKTFS
jgi:poly-gamma-glutamate system protein